MIYSNFKEGNYHQSYKLHLCESNWRYSQRYVSYTNTLLETCTRTRASKLNAFKANLFI